MQRQPPQANATGAHAAVAGAVLAGRYRMLALLGRDHHGRGELRRARDLTLDRQWR